MTMLKTKHLPHCVYRVYDADGALLYVGMTANLSMRIRQHKQGKLWWPSATRVEVEHHADRAAAMKAEQAAIDSEAPAYNQYAGRRPDDVPADVAERLRAAQAAAAKADAAYRREVRAALQHGSVRRVAAALGISPTTVQKWSNER